MTVSRAAKSVVFPRPFVFTGKARTGPSVGQPDVASPESIKNWVLKPPA